MALDQGLALSGGVSEIGYPCGISYKTDYTFLAYIKGAPIGGNTHFAQSVAFRV